MAGDLNLRKATLDDIQEMTEVFSSAFHDSALDTRCFPESDPMSRKHSNDSLLKNIARPGSHLIVVEERSPAPRILGWAGWVRRPAPGPDEPPPTPLTPADFPPTGDGELAARFFNANTDARLRILGDKPGWFLSTIVVRRDAQRRGVGALLMDYGIERADQESWAAYTNASAKGRGLYERYGFKTREVSEFEPEIKTWHMMRDARV